MISRKEAVAGLAATIAALGVGTTARSATGDPDTLELATPSMQRLDTTLWIDELQPGVWIHTTTAQIPGLGYFPANGLIVESANESLMIDTGWKPNQTQQLLDYWRVQRRKPITNALVTHFHTDRLGGLPVLRKAGIAAFGNPLTIGLAVDNGLEPPEPLHDVQKRPTTFDGVEVVYPGEGHTIDNIVVHLPKPDILFGGCLVKSVSAPDLDAGPDSIVASWAATVRAVKQRFPSTRIVVPGHGTTREGALDHSLMLAERALSPNS